MSSPHTAILPTFSLRLKPLRLGILFSCGLLHLGASPLTLADTQVTKLSTPRLELENTQDTPLLLAEEKSPSAPQPITTSAAVQAPKPDLKALQPELEALIEALQASPELAPLSSAPSEPQPLASNTAVTDSPLEALLNELATQAHSREALALRHWPLLSAYYPQRQHQLLWQQAPQVMALIKAIRASEQDGLNPQLYHLALINELLSLQLDQAAFSPRHAALFDILLTDAYIRLYNDYRNGIIDHARLMPSLATTGFAATPLTVQTLIEKSQSAEALDQALAELVPLDERIKRFRSQLVYYRYIQSQGGWPTIAEGPSLSLGDRDARIARIRQRLELSGDLEQNTTLVAGELDAPLAEAIKRFQRRHFLRVDGVLGDSTRAAMNVPIEQRIEQLITNLDRYRWMKHRMQGDYIAVNVAGYSLELVQNNQIIWRTRTVVGKQIHQTPLFSDKIEHIVLNPYWNIPSSILKEELLPEIKKNPNKLQKQQLEILDSSNRIVNPQSIDWSSVDKKGFGYRMRQKPGENNALGQVKFIFPNQHSVYLHDTPAKSLFNEPARAFSHGCIRVEHPLELMQKIVTMQPNMNSTQVKAKLASGQNTWLKLQNQLPVHLVYLTVDINESHQALFMPDIYQHDTALTLAYTNDYLNQPQSHAGLLNTLEPLLALRTSPTGP